MWKVSVQPLTTGARPPSLRAASILLLRGIRTLRQCPGQAGRAVCIGRRWVEQAERGESLLVGAVWPRRGEGLHPGAQLLEKHQLGRHGGRCRETLRTRRGGVRLQRQPALQRTDGRQVSRAIAGPAAHDRGHIRRELNHRCSIGRIRLPPGRYQQEGPGCGPGRPPAHVREVIGPCIDELQHVIPPGRIRDAQQHRPAAHIDLRDGVDGVVVDRHEPVLRPCQLRRMAEAVERRSSLNAGPHVRWASSSIVALTEWTPMPGRARNRSASSASLSTGSAPSIRNCAGHSGIPSRPTSSGRYAAAWVISHLKKVTQKKVTQGRRAGDASPHRLTVWQRPTPNDWSCAAGGNPILVRGRR